MCCDRFLVIPILDESYWSWKYRLNPFGPSILIGAKIKRESGEGEALVGFRAFWRWQFWYGGKIVDAFQPCDTAVRSDHRRGGLFTRMTNEALKMAQGNGIQLLFNNPNPEAKRGYLKMGWQDLGGLRWYIKPVRKIRTFVDLLRWRGTPPECEWTKPNIEWKKQIEEDRLEPLLTKCSFAYPYILWTDRSARFYKWRYQEAPHRVYNLVFWPSSEDYQAILIYGTATRGKLHEVQLLDFLVDVQRKDAMKKALMQLIAIEEPDWITFAASRGFPFLSDLRLCGFLPIPKTADLVGRMLLGSQIPILNSHNIGIVLGDLDTF